MVFIGKVLKFRGNKGEVLITASPDSKVRGDERAIPAVLKSAKYTYKKVIEFVCEINGQIIMKFRGIDTISEALKLIGYEIYIPQAAAVTVQPKDFPDISGFTVWDPSGECWGRVAELEAEEMNPLMHIRRDDGSEIDVPWNESIVRRIDRRWKKVWIDPPAGLKELNS